MSELVQMGTGTNKWGTGHSSYSHQILVNKPTSFSTALNPTRDMGQHTTDT